MPFLMTAKASSKFVEKEKALAEKGKGLRADIAKKVREEYNPGEMPPRKDGYP
jgi:hypothetical protein